MRAEDPEEVKKEYVERRFLKSVYGVVASFVGFAILFWFPAAEWLRYITGWLIILYGGMYIDSAVVREWKELFGKEIPFLEGSNGEDRPGPS